MFFIYPFTIQERKIVEFDHGTRRLCDLYWNWVFEVVDLFDLYWNLALGLELGKQLASPSAIREKRREGDSENERERKMMTTANIL